MTEPFVVGGVADGDDVRIEGVVAGRFLIFGTHEVAQAAFVVAGAVIQQELGHDGVFIDDGHVQHVLSCHLFIY